MSSKDSPNPQWDESASAPGPPRLDSDPMFQLLFERCADAIWLYDPEAGVFVDCNQAAVELMRCGEKAQLLRRRPEDLAPPSQLDGRPSGEASAEIEAEVRKKGWHRFEWLARRFDGTDVPLEVLVTPIETKGRRINVIFSRDITERRRGEAALLASQRLLQSIADNISEALFRNGPDHELMFVNQAYLRMFGYASLEELQAIPRERLYAEPAVRGPLLARLTQHGFFNEEVEYVRKDGTRFWGLAASVAIREPQTGAVQFYVGTITDITERKRLEAEMRQMNASLERRIAERTSELSSSEARLRTLVEHAPEAIVVFDGDNGRFLICNENATRLYGLPREQLITMHPAEVSPLFQPDGRLSLDAAREYIQRALNGETPVFEWMHRHSSGRLVPCEVRLVRLPGEGRNLVRGSVTDNTDRRRREKIQRATYEISEAVHTAGDLDSLYARIHGIIKALMPAQNFYLALFDAATGLVSFPYFIDQRSEKPTPFRLNTGLTGYVLRTGRPLLVDAAMNARKRRIGEAVTFDGFPDLSYIESGAQAAIWLGVPLVSGGRPFGVMAVQDYHDPTAYGEEEKQILSFIAAQTALAIDRKRAEQALRRRTEQMSRHRNALLELALLDKSDFKNALKTICAGAAAASNIARVGYWSLREAGKALECEALHLLERGGLDPKSEGIRIEERAYPSYFAALTTREPMVAHCVETHPHTRELVEGYLQPLGITSMLDVPVWLHGRLAGVLCQEHVGPPREWTAEDIDFAVSVANMVSLSIEAAQRARSELALRDSEQKYRALFQASSQGVMLHDETQFLEVNPATLRILGYEQAGEIIGKHPIDFAPPTQPDGESSAAVAARHIAECMERGSARFEWLSRKGDGAVVPVEVILTRVELGGRTLIQAVIDDISERKQAEAELLRALGREKELSQLKSNFVSMVSHEFRTPLGIIMSSAEILRDYFERLEADERAQHLGSITKSVRRMSELMEEVLVLGRLDAGRMDFQPAPVDLRVLCSRLTDEVMAATEQTCPIDFTAVGLPAEAKADERLLRHIFTNLLSNAMKYSEPGRAVKFSISREGREALCVVSDDGIGIPEPDRARLFNAFYRGSNVGQRPGTGLGLVIVRRCLELHGGRLDVASVVGKGTTVTVRLPVFS